jgi:hypothetical protein
MKKIILLSLLPALLLTGCGNDDDSAPAENPTGMAGKWNLVNQNGGFQGQNIDIEPGDVVWTFNLTDENIAIVNNSEVEDGVNFPTATYNYYMLPNQVSPADCEKTLNLEEMDLGCVSISGNTMIITPVGADMHTLTFKR